MSNYKEYFSTSEPIICPDQQELRDGVCKPIICPDQQVLVDGVCKPINYLESGMTSATVNDKLVCKVNEIVKNGVCYQCGEHQVVNAGVCVCSIDYIMKEGTTGADGKVGASVCIPKVYTSIGSSTMSKTIDCGKDFVYVDKGAGGGWQCVPKDSAYRYAGTGSGAGVADSSLNDPTKDDDATCANCKNIDASTGAYACPNANCKKDDTCKDGEQCPMVCDCGTTCILSEENGICYPYKLEFEKGAGGGAGGAGDKIVYLENINQVLKEYEYLESTGNGFRVIFPPNFEKPALGSSRTIDYASYGCVPFYFDEKTYCIADQGILTKLETDKRVTTDIVSNIAKDKFKAYVDSLKSSIDKIEKTSDNAIKLNPDDKSCAFKFDFNTKTYCVADADSLVTLNSLKTDLLMSINPSSLSDKIKEIIQTAKDTQKDAIANIASMAKANETVIPIS